MAAAVTINFCTSFSRSAVLKALPVQPEKPCSEYWHDEITNNYLDNQIKTVIDESIENVIHQKPLFFVIAVHTKARWGGDVCGGARLQWGVTWNVSSPGPPPREWNQFSDPRNSVEGLFLENIIPRKHNFRPMCCNCYTLVETHSSKKKANPYFIIIFILWSWLILPTHTNIKKVFRWMFFDQCVATGTH